MATKQACQQNECTRVIGYHGARGLCSLHYKRLRAGVDLDSPIRQCLPPHSNTACTIGQCTKVATARRMCPAHWYLWRKHGDPTVKGTPWGDSSERILSLIDKTDSCWLWTGAVNVRGQYGVYNGKYAHRLVYEQLVGPIASGMVIDHICRVHRCVNPEHLRPITRAQNADANRIKTHCPSGHRYDVKNTHIDSKSGRRCRACARLRMASVAAKKASAVPAGN